MDLVEGLKAKNQSVRRDMVQELIKGQVFKVICLRTKVRVQWKIGEGSGAEVRKGEDDVRI